MQRFNSSDQAQRFLAAHGMIYGHFRPRRHLLAGRCLSSRSRESLPDLETGDLRPYSGIELRVVHDCVGTQLATH
jgi:putative transposase